MAEVKNKTRFIIKIVTVIFVLLGAVLVLAELTLNAWTEIEGL